MWHEFKPLVRESSFRQIEKFYVLAYEGEKTEKKYFKDLRVSSFFNDSGKIEILPLKRKSSEGTAPTFVKARLNEAKRLYRFRASDEFWLIVDKDHWVDNQHINLNQLYDSCRREGNFYIALSNPCFEIWLLLHLTQLTRYTEQEIDAIRENKKENESKNHIDIVLADMIDEVRGDGKKRGYNKRPNPNVFMPRVYDAISNAMNLPTVGGKYIDTIGTDVYKLVEKLVKPR